MALLATRPISLSLRRTLSLNCAVEYWHLLSLDAPSVATLWAWSFARALHFTLPATSLLLLFGGTWLLYISDRILDGLRPTARACASAISFIFDTVLPSSPPPFP